jgi:hypothetical protein
MVRQHLVKKKREEQAEEKVEVQEKGEQQDQPTATRIVTDDDTWFFRNGFKEILIAKESVGKCMKDNISSMCMYDIPEVTDEELLRRLAKVLAM